MEEILHETDKKTPRMSLIKVKILYDLQRNMFLDLKFSKKIMPLDNL